MKITGSITNGREGQMPGPKPRERFSRRGVPYDYCGGNDLSTHYNVTLAVHR